MSQARDWTQPSDQTLVEYEVRDGIALITLSDPPANTYSYAMMRQLDDAILRARFANDVHVLVITGAGRKFFCAGANIQMLQEVDPTFKYYFCLHANETLMRLEQTPKLVIAAINGHCVGGGLEVAMAADLRLAIDLALVAGGQRRKDRLHRRPHLALLEAGRRSCRERLLDLAPLIGSCIGTDQQQDAQQRSMHRPSVRFTSSPPGGLRHRA